MRIAWIHLTVGAFFALAAGHAEGAPEIVRCVDAQGRVSYQDTGCAPSAIGEPSGIPTAFPEPNRLERERLFAREAALDKRLEARRDRELLEAQMREARAEREAERERLAAVLAAQAAATGVVLIAPGVARRWYSAGRWSSAHRRPHAGRSVTTP